MNEQINDINSDIDGRMKITIDSRILFDEEEEERIGSIRCNLPSIEQRHKEEEDEDGMGIICRNRERKRSCFFWVEINEEIDRSVYLRGMPENYW